MRIIPTHAEGCLTVTDSFTLEHILNGGATALIVIVILVVIGVTAAVVIMRKKGNFGKNKAEKATEKKD